MDFAKVAITMLALVIIPSFFEIDIQVRNYNYQMMQIDSLHAANDSLQVLVDARTVHPQVSSEGEKP